ncbi:MAG TPA: hypothetical protein VN496_03270 [Burkholderiales bacterium]|nr:hypothetical protein [Burkholderiales bacterium]
MNRFARYAGRLKWLAVFTLGALSAGAVAKDQPVASVAQLAVVAENSGSVVNPIAANTECRSQDNVKRKGTTDGKPAIRTALFTWAPAALKRSFGGLSDTTVDAWIMEAMRERSRASTMQAVVAGGSLDRQIYAATIAAARAYTNGKYKDAMPSRRYAGQRTGWLRMLRPTPARVVSCGNTIEA